MDGNNRSMPVTFGSLWSDSDIPWFSPSISSERAQGRTRKLTGYLHLVFQSDVRLYNPGPLHSPWIDPTRSGTCEMRN